MNIIFTGLFGSHLYGLDTPTSDLDYKSIYIPEYRDIILGKAQKNITRSTGSSNSKNSVDDIDNETFSLQEFVKLACQGQTVAIDCLHVTDTIKGSPTWQYLVENRTKFYSKNMNAFMGYVKKQAAKYGIKGSKLAVLEDILDICDNFALASYYDDHVYLLSEVIDKLPVTEYTFITSNIVVPSGRTEVFYSVNGSLMHDIIPLHEFRKRIQKQYDNYGKRAIQAKNNNGIDWKAISHALRAGYQLKDIFELGDFEYPLRQTQFLLDVKQGKLDYVTEVAPVLEDLVEELDILVVNSNLSENVDTDFWDNFVFDVYTKTSV